MAYKSRFYPSNPDKYSGNPNNIICRSSWERAFCHYIDTNTNIEKWGSEEVVVPYISPIDQRVHRYYTDYVIKFTDGRVVLVEIKPHVQTLEPVKPKRKTVKTTRRYINAVKTYLVNTAKWKAASEFADKHNAEFKIFTEHDLRSMGIKI